MDLLGPNIAKLFEFCDNKFSMKTIYWIGIEMIKRVETMHKYDYIHRDIKPENFLIGLQKHH